MKIIYSKQASKFLKKKDKPTVKRIMTAVFNLPAGDIKKLQGIDSQYRLRVGDFRILFTSSGVIIDIIEINNRGEIYK